MKIHHQINFLVITICLLILSFAIIGQDQEQTTAEFENTRNQVY